VKSALLQALFEGPGACRDLIQRLDAGSSGRVRLRQGQVSLALRSLERDGLVIGWAVPRAAQPGRPRRYFELTSRGIEAATSEREALRGMLGRSSASRRTTARERRAMADRLASAIAVSDFALTLRDAPRRPLV
jgi:DNA-binding PadR family transcriptional regulator